jgi:hypothetical protein
MRKQKMVEVPPQTPITALDRVNNGLSLVQRALARISCDPKCSTVVWSILCDAETQLKSAKDKLEEPK